MSIQAPELGVGAYTQMAEPDSPAENSDSGPAKHCEKIMNTSNTITIQNPNTPNKKTDNDDELYYQCLKSSENYTHWKLFSEQTEGRVSFCCGGRCVWGKHFSFLLTRTVPLILIPTVIWFIFIRINLWWIIL
eukprot:UN27838